MSRTLLLADDSVTTHRVMELTFAGQDVRVVSVADGEQALERLRTMRPDILLAEVALPRVDGYQLAEHVQRTPELAGVPVLLLTGAFDVVDEARVSASGAVGTIVKPFEPEVVIKRVKELLGIAKAEPTPAAGRLVTSAEPPPPRPPAGPRGVGPPPPLANGGRPAPVPPPRQAHIPIPPAPWDQLRQQTGLAPDNAHVEGPQAGGAGDYFDQLDEAFDSLDKQLSGSDARRPATRPAAPMAQQPFAPPADSPIAAPAFEDHQWFDDTTASPAPIAPAPAPPPVPRPAPVPAPPSPPVAAAAAAPPAPHHVADAFEALLAAEQNGVAHAPAAPQQVALAEVDIERIAMRVAERLTEGALKETVVHVVTMVSERLVREEIARIRAKAEAQKR